MKEIGTQEGDVCNRNECEGVLIYSESENCSCHINPPCSSCMDTYLYCPVCDWNETEEDNYRHP